MESQGLRFGGGTAETLLHPIVAVAMALAIILILCLPRRYVIVPLLLGVFLVPKGQVLVLAGAHFTVARILFLAGSLRWLSLRRSLTLPRGYSSIDRIFALWA